MTDKTTETLKLAEEAGWGTGESYDDCIACSRFDVEEFFALAFAAGAAHERENSAKMQADCTLAEPKCNPHPDAPHGFNRNASHNADRYVCDCEGWEPEQEKQEPVAWIEVERGIPMFVKFSEGYNPEGDGFISIYDAPVSAKREWVELTDDEIQEACINYKIDPKNYDPLGQYRAVIAAFKEKNK